MNIPVANESLLIATPADARADPVANESLLVIATPADARRDPLTPNGFHNVGKWQDFERIKFLQGLRRYGRGKWSKIGEGISTR